MQLKKYFSLVVLFIALLSAFSSNVFAESSVADRQTVFNQWTDYIATIGKDEQQKKEIIKDRKHLRRQARLLSESQKKKQLMKSKMKTQEALIMRKIHEHQR